jgi:hypothetical protein
VEAIFGENDEKERILNKNQERKFEMNKQFQWSICSNTILKVQA